MIGNKTISLCIVTNNYEGVKQAQDSVKDIIDETIIIYQGNNLEDYKKLQEIADLVHMTTVKGNADYDRQFCYSLAQKDFVLAMDSDEIIEFTEIEKMKERLANVEFDCCWFLFKNLVSSNGITINLKEMMGEDPHPRLWRKVISKDGQTIPTLSWGHEAHTFPQIHSQRMIFCNIYYTHSRQLSNIVRTHLNRGKNISPQALQVEKKFMQALLERFGNEIKKDITMKIPELIDYLKS